MISDPALYRRRDSVLLWAIALSLLIHLLGFVLYGAFRGHLPAWLHAPEKPEHITVLSSAIRIERITVPELRRAMRQGSQSEQVVRPVEPQPQVRLQRHVTIAPPAHRELTQPAPSASPQPQPQPQRNHSVTPAAQTLAQRLAREQAVFAREVAQLRARDNPLSVATIPPRPAAAYRRAYINISGISTSSYLIEGIAEPLGRSWQNEGRNCYYVRYTVEYNTGGSESGNVPWPICFLPSEDYFAHNEPEVPIRYFIPRSDYVLPSGTYLTPFLRSLYAERGTQ